MATEANSESAVAGVIDAMGAACIGVEEQLKPEEAMSEDRQRQAKAIAAHAETVTFATLRPGTARVASSLHSRHELHDAVSNSSPRHPCHDGVCMTASATAVAVHRRSPASIVYRVFC